MSERKKGMKDILDPLDFLYDDVDEKELNERRKNHDYYKNIIDAIIHDARAVKDFMHKISEIKQ
jgi:hypothetical protein